MIQLLERIQRWQQQILRRLKRRSWKLWLLVIVVAYVVFEVLRAQVSDAGTLLLEWAYLAMRWMANQPMGLAGLALLAYLMLLIGISWWQSQPRNPRRATPPLALSAEEQTLVQDIRTIWRRHGVLAIPQLSGILRDAMYPLENREFWGELLRPVLERLERTCAEFETAISPEHPVGIEAIRNRFNEMYAAYIQVMKWVAILQAKECLDVTNAGQRLAVWRQNHRDMVNRLHDLEQHPSHMSTFKIHLQWVEDPAFRKFLLEAETSPEWLALMRESLSVATQESTPVTREASQTSA